MSPKGLTAGSTIKIQGGCAPSAHLVRTLASTLLGIKGPRDARIELGLSQPQMGLALSVVHPNGHGGRPFKRCTISHYEIGSYRMSSETETAYRVLLERHVADRSGGRMSVRIRFGRTWRLTPLVVCECGATFIPKRWTDKNCKRCRRAHAHTGSK